MNQLKKGNDMMDQFFQFPNIQAMHQCVSNQGLLKDDYYQKKGVTKAIAEIGAQKIAHHKLREADIKLQVSLLISDLQTGKTIDPLEPVPDLEKSGLSPLDWKKITLATELAFISCAQAVES
jgi:hypothetical protein